VFKFASFPVVQRSCGLMGVQKRKGSVMGDFWGWGGGIGRYVVVLLVER